jgi:hypothetical protein
MDDIDMDMYMLLIEYIYDDDLFEAQNVLASHPELVSDEAYQMLQMIEKLYADDPKTSRKIIERQRFLADCIEKGLSTALEEWQASPLKRLQSLPLEIQHRLGNIQSETDFIKFIEAYPELLPVLEQLLEDKKKGQTKKDRTD